MTIVLRQGQSIGSERAAFGLAVRRREAIFPFVVERRVEAPKKEETRGYLSIACVGLALPIPIQEPIIDLFPSSSSSSAPPPPCRCKTNGRNKRRKTNLWMIIRFSFKRNYHRPTCRDRLWRQGRVRNGPERNGKGPKVMNLGVFLSTSAECRRHL